MQDSAANLIQLTVIYLSVLMMFQTSLFEEKDLKADTYRWRQGGKGTMVHIFYQTFQLGPYASRRDQWKRTDEDQYGFVRDIDAVYLKDFFEKEGKTYFPAGMKVSYKAIGTFDKTMDRLKKMDTDHTEYERFDCFMFIFLTFAEVDGRLHFDDTTLEKGLIPLERIIDVVKNLQVARGKPKIFIIQSDDMTLTREKMFLKGKRFEEVPVTIPTDADRLIIQSTIPQAIVNNNDRKESFLIQAFVEAIRDNAVDKEDFLTLTTTINQKIKKWRDDRKHFRIDDMPVALVTSTLTKLVNFH